MAACGGNKRSASGVATADGWLLCGGVHRVMIAMVVIMVVMCGSWRIDPHAAKIIIYPLNAQKRVAADLDNSLVSCLAHLGGAIHRATIVSDAVEKARSAGESVEKLVGRGGDKSDAFGFEVGV